MLALIHRSTRSGSCSKSGPFASSSDTGGTIDSAAMSWIRLIHGFFPSSISPTVGRTRARENLFAFRGTTAEMLKGVGYPKTRSAVNDERRQDLNMAIKMAAATILLLVVGATPGPIVPMGLLKDAHAATGEMDERERRQWLREMHKKRDALLRGNDADHEWGNERRATSSIMVVLDPPLVKTREPKEVEIEWFLRWIDNDGTSLGSLAGMDLVSVWRSSVLENTGREARVYLLYPRSGTGLAPEYEQQRDLSRRMDYGSLWYQKEGKAEEREKLFAKMVETARIDQFRGFDSEAKLKAAVEKQGIDWEDWQADTARWSERLGRHADRRWKLMAERALRQTDGGFDTLPDPVLLIEGKYLLTTNTVKGQGGSAKTVLKRLFESANWLVREALEARPEHGFDAAKIRWGNEGRPKRREMLHLKERLGTEPAGGIEVEWLFTYITDDGQAKDIGWMEEQIGGWHQSLEDAGIKVQIRQSPIVSDSGRFVAQQRVHQRIATAWGADEGDERGYLHRGLKRYLYTSPRGMRRKGEEKKFIASTVSNFAYAEYDEAVASERTARELAMLEAKAAAVAELARKRRGRRDPGFLGKDRRDPVFLVDGRYVLMSDNVTDTFQSLNWLIRQIREDRSR